MRELTKAEEQVMQHHWTIEKGFGQDIFTVRTIVRILQEKGFVSHRAYGRTHEYFPLVSRDVYKKNHMASFVRNYFANSYGNMVSFFANEKELTVSDMEDIMKLMENEISRQKK